MRARRSVKNDGCRIVETYVHNYIFLLSLSWRKRWLVSIKEERLVKRHPIKDFFLLLYSHDCRYLSSRS